MPYDPNRDADLMPIRTHAEHLRQRHDTAVRAHQAIIAAHPNLFPADHPARQRYGLDGFRSNATENRINAELGAVDINASSPTLRHATNQSIEGGDLT